MKTAERFIKKQVTVEAIQFNGNSNRAGIELFVGKELKTELESETAYIAGHGAPIFSLLIETKEGVMKAFKNDWIIKEPFPTGDRDFYPCKSDIFEKTYSPLASHPSPMSAEQVEVLHAIMVLAEHGIPGYAFGDNEAACEMDNRLSEICRLASTTPSVKADGWVSVEDELPKVGQKVDLWLVPDDEEKSYRMTWTWEKESTARITINGCKVTHWQPFAPPKQQL